MAQKRLSMRKIKEIIRLRFEKNLSQQSIAYSLLLPKSTVGDCLSRLKSLGLNWSEALIFSEEELETALYPGVPKDKKEVIAPDWSYVHQELRRKGVTLQLLWEEHKASYPGGHSYSQFCYLYRRFKKRVEYVFRNNHRGGEKLFVDYAGMTVPILSLQGEASHNAQIFIATFGASNFTFAEATWSQKTCDWIASHQRALQFFGGAPEILVPDNLRSGVSKACRWDPDINPVYHEMATHYGSVVMPARVRKPKDKAKVENAVLVVERWILAALRNRQFYSLGELNDAIEQLLTRLNTRPFKKLKGSRSSHFADLDKPCLKSLPTKMFEFAEYKLAKVNINYHIEVAEHNYSVPYTFVHKKVEIRYSSSTVEILYKGKRVCSHARAYKQGGYTTITEHMPPSHGEYVSWTPERLSRWAMQAGLQTQKVAETIMISKAHPQQGFKAVLGIIRMGKMYGNERLEAACAKAISIGSPSYKSVKSLLKSRLERHDVNLTKNENSILPFHSNIRGKEYYLRSQFKEI
jgi:transposase